jgi:hypothetical protein
MKITNFNKQTITFQAVDDDERSQLKVFIDKTCEPCLFTLRPSGFTEKLFINGYGSIDISIEDKKSFPFSYRFKRVIQVVKDLFLPYLKLEAK